jgi:hypothetical protein
MPDIERKREYQRGWVRAKRRSNPRYAESERRRHEDWRARHVHHVELYERVRLTRNRAEADAADTEGLTESMVPRLTPPLVAPGVEAMESYWAEWIEKAERAFAEHDEATCNWCIYNRDVRNGTREAAPTPRVLGDFTKITLFGGAA